MGTHRSPPPREPVRPRPGGFRLGSALGFPIAVDASWLIVFALVTFSLYGWTAAGDPGLPDWQLWTASIATSVLFFGSILVHELSHSLVARGRGLEVRGITLFVFGGISMLTGQPSRPRDEFQIAVVGPLTSLALGGLFLAAWWAQPAGGLIRGCAGWLAFMNFALAVFNLLPGFPLDGGRVLRAGAWAVTHDFVQATRISVATAIGISYGLMFLGVLLALFIGNLLGGLWLGFIGWFLHSAAQQSLAQVVMRDQLAGYTVDMAMHPVPALVDPKEPVSRVIEEHLLRGGYRCVLVSRDGELGGLLTLHELRAVPRDRWPSTAVEEVMRPLEEVERASPDTPLLDALERMDALQVNQLPVLEGRVLKGLLSRRDILHLLSMHLELRTGDSA